MFKFGPPAKNLKEVGAASAERLRKFMIVVGTIALILLLWKQYL